MPPRPRLAVGLLACFALFHAPAAVHGQSPAPHTDPENHGGWVLVPGVSDEFNGDRLDTDKWHIQGEGGHYENNFVGRAPSQFSPGNVRVEDGTLRLLSRWEPGFAFSPEPQRGVRYENITTAAVITRETFAYGYMETRCRAADGPISSAFWAIGRHGELDVFEHFRHNPDRPESGRRYHTSFHDWRDPQSPTWSQRVWTNDHLLDFRVADGFHVYGLEWDADYLRIYADGVLVRHVTREEVGDAWVADHPMKVWLDSEAFPWEMDPARLTAGDFPGDGLAFEIDYVRVWQRREGHARPPRPAPSPNLLENAGLTQGLDGWSVTGGASVIEGDGLAVRIEGESTVSQRVALRPDTTYLLSLEGRTPGTADGHWENAWVGVRGHGGEEVRRLLFRPGFYRVSLQFTTGPDASGTTVFLTNDRTGHTAEFAALHLQEAQRVGGEP